MGTCLGPNAKIQIAISLDKTVADLKEAIAEADEKKETPVDRQRLIYSGEPTSIARLLITLWTDLLPQVVF